MRASRESADVSTAAVVSVTSVDSVVKRLLRVVLDRQAEAPSGQVVAGVAYSQLPAQPTFAINPTCPLLFSLSGRVVFLSSFRAKLFLVKHSYFFVTFILM